MQFSCLRTFLDAPDGPFCKWRMTPRTSGTRVAPVSQRGNNGIRYSHNQGFVIVDYCHFMQTERPDIAHETGDSAGTLFPRICGRTTNTETTGMNDSNQLDFPLPKLINLDFGFRWDCVTPTSWNMTFRANAGGALRPKRLMPLSMVLQFLMFCDLLIKPRHHIIHLGLRYLSSGTHLTNITTFVFTTLHHNIFSYAW